MRPTWVEIDLEKLAFNFNSVKNFIGGEIGFMAVVKADAYGHGAVECAKKLTRAGVDWFGVALPEEGSQLRDNGIDKPILCLCGFWEGQEKLIISKNLTPVIYRLELAERLNREARKQNLITDIHVKIDTGMGRIGVRFDQVRDFADSLQTLKNLRVDGLMTHFANADDLSQNEFTQDQINKFDEAVAIFYAKGFRPTYQDLANSPGAIAHRNSLRNLVRVGGILYGLGDDVLPKEIVKPELKAVMSLYSRITLLKKVAKGETLGYSRTFTTKSDSLIATVPIGYQDGYSRMLSNKGRVIINQTAVPVVGRISMDWTILDVTEVPNVQVNDKVIFIGSSNDLKVTAEELAELTDTISYEITCGINRRVSRKYVGS
jgi:alanine racemase